MAGSPACDARPSTGGPPPPCGSRDGCGPPTLGPSVRLRWIRRCLRRIGGTLPVRPGVRRCRRRLWPRRGEAGQLRGLRSICARFRSGTVFWACRRGYSPREAAGGPARGGRAVGVRGPGPQGSRQLEAVPVLLWVSVSASGSASVWALGSGRSAAGLSAGGVASPVRVPVPRWPVVWSAMELAREPVLAGAWVSPVAVAGPASRAGWPWATWRPGLVRLLDRRPWLAGFGSAPGSSNPPGSGSVAGRWAGRCRRRRIAAL